MSLRSRQTQAETLVQYKLALNNALTQEQIATSLAELGYNSEKIQEGKSILEETEQAFRFNQQEDIETSEAYTNFEQKKNTLHTIYALHRKKAKVVFRKDPITLEKLGLSSAISRVYIKWLELLKQFYTTAINDTQIQTKLAALQITVEDLNMTTLLIVEVENARELYYKEKENPKTQQNLKIKHSKKSMIG
ncbi:hypothetical protein [Aureivirga marina]|uniref:hypothetical protein n=1 Tax=Aureivirga marina TaxID=1182451 RepID=UPI001E50B16C|nr:hypothetical protein [Aureivirga marina]